MPINKEELLKILGQGIGVMGDTQAVQGGGDNIFTKALMEQQKSEADAAKQFVQQLTLYKSKKDIDQAYDPTDIADPKGLSSEQQLQAHQLARNVGGVRGMGKILPSVYEMMRQGKGRDQIEDELRFSGQSGELGNEYRSAVQSIMLDSPTSVSQNVFDYVDDLLQAGNVDGAKDQLKRMSRAKSGVEEGRSVSGKERTLELVGEIEQDLKTLEDNGISTNIFSGKTEDILKKVGQVKSPELRQIATKIAVAVQNYRRSMSGVAFSQPETKEYRDIFPSIERVGKFNTATINALKDVMSGDLDKFYELSMGKGNYDKLFKSTKENIVGGNDIRVGGVFNGERITNVKVKSGGK